MMVAAYRIERRESGEVKCKAIPLDKKGPPYYLDTRTDLVNHSPTGFDVGYVGSGPAQLSLAILADASSDETALEKYHDFKWEFISDVELDPGDSVEIVITQNATVDQETTEKRSKAHDK